MEDMNAEKVLNKENKVKEAALLREAAQLLASVENDRSLLEKKLKQTRVDALNTIRGLENDLSNQKLEHQTTHQELSNQISQLQVENSSLQRDFEIMKECNLSMKEENLHLHNLISKKYEEVMSLNMEYQSQLSENDDRVQSIVLQNDALQKSHTNLQELLNYYNAKVCYTCNFV